MQRVLWLLLLSFFPCASSAALAQNQPSAEGPAQSAALTADFPTNKAGILIQSKGWNPIANQVPAKSKVAHAFAAGISFGAAPAKVVVEYGGEHAATQVETAQPVLCVCHLLFAGSPLLVRLHPKKGLRELDGGKLTVNPITGGSKMADANKSDLIPADVSQPDPQVVLVRPQSPLEPGEYALMLGAQNMNIFPFTVIPPSSQPNPAN